MIFPGRLELQQDASDAFISIWVMPTTLVHIYTPTQILYSTTIHSFIESIITSVLLLQNFQGLKTVKAKFLSN